MFSYIASLGTIVGIFVGVSLVYFAVIGLVKIKESASVAQFFFERTYEQKICALRIKMAAILFFGIFLIGGGILAIKFKEIAWMADIIFGVVGVALLWRLRCIKEEILRVAVAIAGLLLLAPPLYWLWHQF